MTHLGWRDAKGFAGLVARRIRIDKCIGICGALIRNGIGGAGARVGQARGAIGIGLEVTTPLSPPLMYG